MATQRLRVTPPKVQAIPYGLLSVVDIVESSDPHWQNGVYYQPDVCDIALVTSGVCVTGAGTTKTPSSVGLRAVGADPVTVYAWIDCSVPGFLDEARARTEAALVNGEAQAIEGEFESGAVGMRPHLASALTVIEDRMEMEAAAVTLTNSHIDVVEAIGLLEEALGDCYGGLGVIHVPRNALASLAAFRQIEVSGSKLTTVGGTPIAAGSGYEGLAPGGAAPAPGDAWFYATGTIRGWRSEVFSHTSPGEVVNRAKNSVVMISERTYVLRWDCCLFAAQTQLGGVQQGAVG